MCTRVVRAYSRSQPCLKGCYGRHSASRRSASHRFNGSYKSHGSSRFFSPVARERAPTGLNPQAKDTLVATAESDLDLAADFYDSRPGQIDEIAEVCRIAL